MGKGRWEEEDGILRDFWVPFSQILHRSRPLLRLLLWHAVFCVLFFFVLMKLKQRHRLTFQIASRSRFLWWVVFAFKPVLEVLRSFLNFCERRDIFWLTKICFSVLFWNSVVILSAASRHVSVLEWEQLLISVHVAEFASVEE